MMATRRALSVQRTALLVATVLALGTSLWALREMSRDVDEVRTRTAPAILEVTEAQRALAGADRAATVSFRSEESELAGFRPGEEYQNRLGIANQSLAQAAEDNSAGALGSRILQVVEGQLVSYTGWIGQAAAHYRQKDNALGAADLWYAAQLMHNEPDGILSQLDRLLKEERKKLADGKSTGWTEPVTVVVWAVSVAALFLLLAVAQVFLGVRFRRVTNPLLLAATLLVAVAPVLGAGLALESRGHLDDAATTLDRVVGARQRETERRAAAGRQALYALVTAECGAGTTACGPTVKRFAASVPSTPVDAAEENSADTITAGKAVNRQTGNAQVSPNASFVVVVIAVAVILLIQWGFRARLDEYRFQPR